MAGRAWDDVIGGLLIGAVDRPGGEIARLQGRAVLAGGDGVGGDIGAGRVQPQDVAGRAGHHAASVAPTQRPKVGLAGERAVSPAQGLVAGVFIGQQDMTARPGAAQGLTGQIPAVAALGGARAHQPGLAAVKIMAQADVDHPADRVGPIERRGPVEQDIDLAHGHERDRREVGKVAKHPGAGHATAVDQHQGRIRPQAPQVHARAAHEIGAVGIGPR